MHRRNKLSKRISETNDIGYAGYIFNDESQNYHVRNREYSPKLGRWLQRDPLDYPDGMNKYQNVWSNPTRYRDPFGLAPPITLPDDKGIFYPDPGMYFYDKDGNIEKVAPFYQRPNGAPDFDIIPNKDGNGGGVILVFPPNGDGFNPIPGVGALLSVCGGLTGMVGGLMSAAGIRRGGSSYLRWCWRCCYRRINIGMGKLRGSWGLAQKYTS